MKHDRTRMTICMKANLKKSDDQTNINKYRVDANITKCQKSTCLKWTYGLFGYNYRVATLSTLYQTVLDIIIPSLKSIGQL